MKILRKKHSKSLLSNGFESCKNKNLPQATLHQTVNSEKQKLNKKLIKKQRIIKYNII